MSKEQQKETPKATDAVNAVKAVPAPNVPAEAKPIRMPPQIWGPIFWSTLHIASLAYSDEPTDRQKKHMRNFYESMVEVLPCPICRHHYAENLKELPIDDALDSRMALVTWVWNMHNKINVELGKREFTFEEFIESMQNLEKAKKAVPPSFHENNKPNLEKAFDLSNFSIFDGILLGTGGALLAGVGAYYLYQEGIRKGSK